MIENINLSGLLYINGHDMWTTYGVFLYEEKVGESQNYAALLKPATCKPIKSVSYIEENGERMPTLIRPTLDGRDVTLVFGILSHGPHFISRYKAFLNLLRSGWLDILVTDLNMTYRMRYISAADYKQLSDLGEQIVGASISVKLREPNPKY
ncbi:MAG: hypothetical protein SPI72_03280 [Porphyromonas sp.]|nr:hypothetical protein [Porphyromonas sp.]